MFLYTYIGSKSTWLVCVLASLERKYVQMKNAWNLPKFFFRDKNLTLYLYIYYLIPERPGTHEAERGSRLNRSKIFLKLVVIKD